VKMLSEMLDTIILTFSFYLLSIVSDIFSTLTFKTNRYLAGVFLLIGIVFLVIGIFLAIFMAISFFKK